MTPMRQPIRTLLGPPQRAELIRSTRRSSRNKVICFAEFLFYFFVSARRAVAAAAALVVCGPAPRAFVDSSQPVGVGHGFLARRLV